MARPSDEEISKNGADVHPRGLPSAHGAVSPGWGTGAACSALGEGRWLLPRALGTNRRTSPTQKGREASSLKDSLWLEGLSQEAQWRSEVGVGFHLCVCGLWRLICRWGGVGSLTAVSSAPQGVYVWPWAGLFAPSGVPSSSIPSFCLSVPSCPTLTHPRTVGAGWTPHPGSQRALASGPGAGLPPELRLVPGVFLHWIFPTCQTWDF